jgi:tetratricopeptide (TPR) repeat protein
MGIDVLTANNGTQLRRRYDVAGDHVKDLKKTSPFGAKYAMCHYSAVAAAGREGNCRNRDGQAGLSSRPQSERGAMTKSLVTWMLILCIAYLASCGISSPPSPDVKTMIESGNSYMESGDYKKAIASYDSVLSLLEGTENPNLSIARYNRGLVLSRMRMYERAISDFSSVIERNPGDAHAYYQRGHAFAKISAFDRAVEDYSLSLNIDPDNVDTYYALAMIHFTQNDYKKTAHVLSKAIVLKPDFGKAYNGRGQAYLKSGLLDKALDDFRTACELGEECGCIMTDITLKACETSGRTAD